MVATERYSARGAESGVGSEAREIGYVITGTDDEETALAQLDSAASGFWNGLPRDTISVEQIGQNEWNGTATYKNSDPNNQPTGGSSFQFAIKGQGQRVYQNLWGPTFKYPDAASTPDFKGGINFTGERFEGVDKLIPDYSFSETHYVPVASINQAYRNILFASVGAVNNAAFKGFAAGECLFEGVSGSLRNSDDWELSYDFRCAPNVVLTIDTISGIAKAGWDYLWVRRVEVDDDDSKAIIPKVISVYVEQIYARSDFSLLGIGT